jgi:hypothetical protein
MAPTNWHYGRMGRGETYRRGRVAVVANRDELVAVVRARDHPGVGRHVAPPSDAGDGGREREGESAREAP